MSQACRTPRRPDIYAYAQDLGIDPSLIRPIDTVASSRKNKSRQGITIRKNKQPVSIGQSSNSRVNRTDSAHSINARSASNMIPCFPANNSTDMHHYDIVSSRSSPSHFTNDTPLNISNINSILAVIYVTKLQNLINRLVMNCSMNIFLYFHFSNNILFGFSKQWFNFFVVDLVLTLEILRGVSFVK